MISQCPSPTWDSSNQGSAYVDELGAKALYGNFYNTNQAQHVNDGHLYFFGDITNNGFMGDGFGHEYIKSCNDLIPTTITGRGGTEFNILDINNKAGVTLQKDLRIKTTLSFSAGLVTTNRTKFGHRVFFQDGASHLSAANSRHINGRVSRKGDGFFSFPTGDGDHISKLSIVSMDASIIYTATYYSLLLDPDQYEAEGLYDRNSKEFDVLAVQPQEHWTLRGSKATTVTLEFTDYSDIGALTSSKEDLIVVGWDGRQWVDLGNTKFVEAFGRGTITSKSVIPNEYRIFTFGVRDTDGDTYADGIDLDPRDPCIPDPTDPACTERICVEVDTKVFLEGAIMQGGIGRYGSEMRSEINHFGYLPGQAPSTLLGSATPAGQPYSSIPWYHEGPEGITFNYLRVVKDEYTADVVDWVLVSLRTDAGVASTTCTKAGLLYSDGTIEMTEPFDCCNSNETDYYIVIEHRNHLPVMTPTPMPVVNGIVSFDFRSQQSYTRLLGNGQKEFKDGLFAMYGGNGDQRTASESPKDINSNDVSLWALDNGKHSGYFQQDYDLNGDVNVHDKALWLMNNGIFSDVER